MQNQMSAASTAPRRAALRRASRPGLFTRTLLALTGGADPFTIRSGLLFALLASGLALPGAAFAQQTPVPGTRTANSVSPAGPTTQGAPCPPGSQLQTLVVESCFPSNCTSLNTANWQGRVLSLPKFDSSLGNLIEVRLRYEGDLDAYVCWDNRDQDCCLSFSFNAFADFTLAQGTNSPALNFNPGSPLTISYTSPIIPLGPDDGHLDCFMGQNGTLVGPCLDGNLYDDSGQDQVFLTDDLAYPRVTDPVELAKWIQGTGNPNVEFLSSATSNAIGSFCGSGTIDAIIRGKAKLEVTYLYCTNSPPVCVGEGTPVITAEDTPVDIFLIDRVADLDGCIDCSTFQITTQPSHGTLSGFLGCTGQGGSFPGCNDCGQCRVVYTPAGNYCGPDQFSFTVQDDDGASVTCTVLIQVTPVNDPPVCTKAAFSMAEDTFLDIDLCALSSDIDGLNGCGSPLDCGAFVIVNPPSCGGTLAHLGNGVYRFTPPANYCGSCSFTYRAADAGGRLSEPCTINITVNPVNDPPVCSSASFNTAEDTPLLIDLCALVTDVDNATGCGDVFNCNIQIVQQPTCGTLTPQGNGTFLFTPNANFCGQCTFTYRALDSGNRQSAICTVTLTVTGVNDPPVCVGTTVTTAEDTAVLIDFSLLVTDIDNGTPGCGNPWTCGIEIVSPPSCGTLEQVSCAVWRFTPTPNFCGNCSFTFRAVDGGGATSAVCTVNLVVTPVNDPPVCSSANFSTAEDTPLLIDLCALVTDADNANGCGDVFNCDIQIVQPPSCGTLTPQGNGTFTFTPNANFCGQCTFTYRALDSGGRQSAICTVTLTVTGVNDPPVCVGTTVTTAEDTSVLIDFSLLVTDIDNGTPGCGNPWTCGIEIVSPPSCGTLEQVSCAVWRFTPTPNFCGNCSFTFRAVDGGGATSAVCTVNLVVTPVNDPPVCSAGSFSTAEDTPLLIDLCALVTDVDNANGCGDVFNCDIQIVQPPTCGTLTPQGNGTFTFTPNPNFCGQCTFTYRAVDAGGRQSPICTVTLTVTPVNDPPVCVGTTVTTPEDTAVLIDFSGLVTDVDNPPNGCGGAWTCGIEIVTPPSCGTLEEVSCAVWRFTPSANFCGQCTFTYRARDGQGRGSEVCTVTVVVTAVNDPPVCVGTTVTTAEDQSVVIDFSSLVTDIDNGTPGCGSAWSCGIEIVSPPSCGTLTEIGCALWQFTPNPNFCGQCTFTFRARDAGGATSQICTVTIVVTPVNDPPVCVGTSVVTNQGTPLLIDLAPLVSDTDNPPNGCGSPWNCDIQIVSPPTCGTLVPVAGCAVFQFTPSPGFCGSCSFTFRARDAQGRLSEICTVNITVNPVNLPPVAVDDFAVTDKNVPVLISVCVNDSDPNDGTGCGAPLDCCSITYLGDVSCPGAIVEKVVDGGTCKFRFTPPPDFIGTCTFTYRICDTGTPPLCDEAVVTIEIVERCDPTGLRQPGSLLLYPEFDNRNGIVTVYTITNTSRTNDIRVKFWYVNKEDCSTFDRTNYLTALDTLTLITNHHNPQYEQGFCYVVAMCPSGSTRPVVFNHLAGQMHVLDGIENFGFSINAVAFPGIGEGAGLSACGLRFADVNNNGLHELDGIEYGPAPDEILMPRFFGQDEEYNSELILIGLSGGKQFTTIVDFLVYNDNEQVFSAEHTFYCWTRVNLLDINAVFSAEFLRNWTTHDPNEVLGDPSIETGWMRIKGAMANSINTTILNPAIYAVLIERSGPMLEVADLPWGRCSRETGKLLPKTNTGQ